MSGISNSQNAWSKFKSLAQQVMGTKELSDAQLKKLMNDSDSNGDGLFSLDELKEALSSYDEYMDLGVNGCKANGNKKIDYVPAFSKTKATSSVGISVM